MASEQGLAVDEDGFRRLMGEQRDRAKADAKAKKSGHVDVAAYRRWPTSPDARSSPATPSWRARASCAGSCATARWCRRPSQVTRSRSCSTARPSTPRVAASWPTGALIRLANGAVIEVDDVQQPVEGLIVHRGRVVDGSAETGLAAVGTIDIERRRAISRAHTATHMVHKAMRELVGETATQAGSENAPGRFRFDFPNAGAVPAERAGRRRAEGQRGADRRPVGHGRAHADRRGAGVWCHGAVR